MDAASSRSGSSLADGLAALRDGGRNPKPADRPRRLKLDAGIAVELPSPRVLAHTFALPTLAAASDVYANGAAIVRRPHGATIDPVPVPFALLVDELRAALEVLPDRDDAGRPYRDLKVYLLDGDPAQVAGYLYDTVKAVRIAAPKRPQAERQERTGPPKTLAKRQSEFRERRRAAEIESADEWLRDWLDEAESGTRISAPELYELAAEAIEDWDEAVPGPRVFYARADELIGSRVRGAQGVRVYVVSTIAADLVQRTEHMNDQEGRKAA